MRAVAEEVGVITTRWHVDLDGTVVEERIQDVEPIFENNRAEANAGLGKGDAWWKVASIPLVIVEQWLREDGINIFDRNHLPAVMRKLNDPDYSHLRVVGGRL